jgi:hypothetical protein
MKSINDTLKRDSDDIVSISERCDPNISKSQEEYGH